MRRKLIDEGGLDRLINTTLARYIKEDSRIRITDIDDVIRRFVGVAKEGGYDLTTTPVPVPRPKKQKGGERNENKETN